MLRLFTRVGGVAFALLGVAGLLGLLGLGVGDAVLYLLTGVLFSYFGFGQWSGEAIRGLVSGIGALYLLCGAALIAVLFVLDLPIEGADVVRVALGALILGAAFLRCEDGPTAGP